MPELRWVLMPGGVCRFGDRCRPRPVPPLLWMRTLVTWAQCDRMLPLGTAPQAADTPIVGLSHQEAAALAGELGGRLPSSLEWEWMAVGPEQRRYPWGEEAWTRARANLRSSGYGRPTQVDAHPAGATPLGLLDVAGNVWEWTATPVLGDGAIIRGGSYASLPSYALGKFVNAAPRELRSRGIGLRVVREP